MCLCVCDDDYVCVCAQTQLTEHKEQILAGRNLAELSPVSTTTLPPKPPSLVSGAVVAGVVVVVVVVVMVVVGDG